MSALNPGNLDLEPGYVFSLYINDNGNQCFFNIDDENSASQAKIVRRKLEAATAITTFQGMKDFLEANNDDATFTSSVSVWHEDTRVWMGHMSSGRSAYHKDSISGLISLYHKDSISDLISFLDTNIKMEANQDLTKLKSLKISYFDATTTKVNIIVRKLMRYGEIPIIGIIPSCCISLLGLTLIVSGIFLSVISTPFVFSEKGRVVFKRSLHLIGDGFGACLLGVICSVYYGVFCGAFIKKIELFKRDRLSLREQ